MGEKDPEDSLTFPAEYSFSRKGAKAQGSPRISAHVRHLKYPVSYFLDPSSVDYLRLRAFAWNISCCALREEKYQENCMRNNIGVRPILASMGQEAPRILKHDNRQRENSNPKRL
jgi:hypothetical protein